MSATATRPKRVTASAPGPRASRTGPRSETGSTVEAGLAESAMPASVKGGSKRLRNISAWSRQLLILLGSGTPLTDATGAIARQVEPGRWRDVLDDLNRQLEEGVTLTEAMSQHPHVFDPICLGLIAAGESAGQMETMLSRLAQLTRQQLRLRRTLGGAMLYPVILIAVACIVVIAMLGFVLPRFADLFTMLDVALPPTTRVLVVLSEVMRSYWWVGLLGLAGTGAVVKLVLSSAPGRRAADVLLLRLPFFGNVKRNLETARIARLMGVLLESKVPILEAITITRQAAGSAMYRDLLGETLDSVSQGESLSISFGKSRLISPSVTEAIHHGERSGQTGAVMTNLADFMDEDNEALVKTVSSVVEPLILIVLGLIVAFIALSLFLPLFDLTSMTQG